MLARLGRFVTRRAVPVLAAAAVLLVLAAVVGAGAVGKLKGGGFVDPRSESQQAQNRLDEGFGGRPNLLLLVTARTGGVDDPAVTAAGQALASRLSAETGVSSVLSYWSTGAPSLRSTDSRQALVLGHVDGEDKQAQERARTLVATYAKPGAPAPV